MGHFARGLAAKKGAVGGTTNTHISKQLIQFL